MLDINKNRRHSVVETSLVTILNGIFICAIQRMSDMAPILRRRPGDFLPRLPKGNAGSSSSGYGQQLSLKNSIPVPPSAKGKNMYNISYQVIDTFIMFPLLSLL